MVWMLMHPLKQCSVTTKYRIIFGKLWVMGRCVDIFSERPKHPSVPTADFVRHLQQKRIKKRQNKPADATPRKPSDQFWALAPASHGLERSPRYKMLLRLIALMMCGSALFGCASSQIGVSEEEQNLGKGTVGSWTNIYRGDPNLAGVIVQQFPDGDDGFSFDDRDGKHPCMIIYGFWDDRFHQISYTPSGQIEENFWFEISESTTWIWDGVDFSHGSDPKFAIHPDPRIRWSHAINNNKKANKP
jgi:hypothetical protein